MTRADLKPPRSARLAVAAVVVVLHLLAAFALVRAFAPNLPAQVAEQVLETFSVTVVTPPPKQPQPPPRPGRAPGAQSPAGRKATPREVTAPKPRIAISASVAPTVASTGSANSAGAAQSGTGTGAGGTGNGLGGGSLAAPAVKIAGDINSARDYPRETRDQRIGDYVIIALTVTPEGRVGGCRVVRPSGEPRTDAVTCRLATDRFRFRPALDAAGRPVQSVYGWKQRWFYPDAQR